MAQRPIREPIELPQNNVDHEKLIKEISQYNDQSQSQTFDQGRNEARRMTLEKGQTQQTMPMETDATISPIKRAKRLLSQVGADHDFIFGVGNETLMEQHMSELLRELDRDEKDEDTQDTTDKIIASLFKNSAYGALCPYLKNKLDEIEIIKKQRLAIMKRILKVHKFLEMADDDGHKKKSPFWPKEPAPTTFLTHHTLDEQFTIKLTAEHNRFCLLRIDIALEHFSDVIKELDKDIKHISTKSLTDYHEYLCVRMQCKMESDDGADGTELSAWIPDEAHKVATSLRGQQFGSSVYRYQKQAFFIAFADQDEKLKAANADLLFPSASKLIKQIMKDSAQREQKNEIMFANSDEKQSETQVLRSRIAKLEVMLKTGGESTHRTEKKRKKKKGKKKETSDDKKQNGSRASKKKGANTKRSNKKKSKQKRTQPSMKKKSAASHRAVPDKHKGDKHPHRQ